MTVRTDKIQSLTGSAPLTLPKTLPASKKNVKVDTSGNISTPNTTLSFSSLGAGGETGWVLLGTSQTLAWSNGCEVSIEGSGYSASDIYMYKCDFDIESNRQQATGNNFMVAPYNGTTNISQAYMSYAGYYNRNNSTSNGAYNTGAQTGTNNGYELYFSSSVSGNSSNTYDYDSMFDPAGANDNMAYKGGIRGSFRYYNGAGMRSVLIDPLAYSVDEWNSSYYNNSQGYYCKQFFRKGNTKYNSPTNSSFADKFRILNADYAGDNSGAGNATYFQRGYMSLYGIPKTG